MIKYTLLCIALTTTLFSVAQKPATLGTSTPAQAGMSAGQLQRIDQMVEGYMGKQWLPGAVVLIVKDNKVVYNKAYGYSDADTKTPMTTSNIFRIASQSKAITALAVMMLFEEGKFLLDDPIYRYIPEYKNQKVLATFNEKDTTYTTVPAKKNITIRQLLTHTSGLDYPVIGSSDMVAIYAKAAMPSGIGASTFTIANKMKALAALPLKHQPGKQFTYGLNYDLLGYLVEVLSGVPFDTFLQQRIFTPLEMNDTFFKLPTDKQNKLVPLYMDDKAGIKKVPKGMFDNADPDYPKLANSYFSGGAGLSSAIGDYAKFLQLFLNGGQYNGARLLGRKTIEMMLTNQLADSLGINLGLGFAVETAAYDFESIQSVGSFEWSGAFNTYYWADPKEKLIGLIYTNIIGDAGGTRVGRIGSEFKVLTYAAIE